MTRAAPDFRGGIDVDESLVRGLDETSECCNTETRPWPPEKGEDGIAFGGGRRTRVDSVPPDPQEKRRKKRTRLGKATFFSFVTIQPDIHAVPCSR